MKNIEKLYTFVFKNIIISPIAKNPNKAKEYGHINLRLFD